MQQHDVLCLKLVSFNVLCHLPFNDKNILREKLFYLSLFLDKLFYKICFIEFKKKVLTIYVQTENYVAHHVDLSP